MYVMKQEEDINVDLNIVFNRKEPFLLSYI